MLGELPENLPLELRSDLRKAVDKNLDYSQMRGEISKLVSSRLSAAAIERNLRWWTSPAGREIYAAESAAYSSFNGRPVDPPRPLPPPGKISGVTVEQVVEEGGFISFADIVRRTNGAIRDCLWSTLTLAPDCSAAQPGVANSLPGGDARSRTAGAIRSGYVPVPTEELSSYLAYLREGDTKSEIASLHSSMLEVERDHLDRARAEAKKAIRRYVTARIGDPKEALRKIVAAIDAGRDLEQARTSLVFLRYVDEENPALFVELARVAMKLGLRGSYFDIPGEPPPVAAASREEARRWLEQAHALNPRRADTLVLEGYLAYLNKDYDRGISLLEQARKIGTTNPWLGVNLADTLWTRGTVWKDTASVERAAQEFETATSGNLPAPARSLAYHELGDIYQYLGETEKAANYERRYVATMDECCRGYALQRYSLFLLNSAHDVDGALVAVREGIKSEDSAEAEKQLVLVLLVKSGKLYSAGQTAQARALVDEARRAQPDLESEGWMLASLEVTYPGIRALHAASILTDFSGPVGGLILERTAKWAGAAEIEELLAWGANPNYMDPEEGTPLRRAILSDNVAAVKVLLAHGADTTARDKNGRLPRELIGDLADTQRAEILAMVGKAGRQGVPAVPTASAHIPRSN
jgi:tetratricopeptide (TPR) repeat protein